MARSISPSFPDLRTVGLGLRFRVSIRVELGSAGNTWEVEDVFVEVELVLAVNFHELTGITKS